MRGETVCTLGGWASKTNKDRGCIHPFNLKQSGLQEGRSALAS